MYDVAVIGAGINGCSVAYYLAQSGKKVALFDKEGIAHGGSGAAGAFISPKFSKAGELKELIEKSYLFSLDFYAKNFGQFLQQAPLLHIAKDEIDAKKLQAFKENTGLKIAQTPLHAKCPLGISNILTCKAQESENVYLLNGGVVDAVGVCHAMAQGIDFFQEEIDSLLWENDRYKVGSINAKHVVLACGAYEPILKEPYIKLRGIWGHRIDISTSTRTEATMHHYVSLSKCSDGKMAVGATHNVHYHPQKNSEPYDVSLGREELLQKANMTIELKNVKILKDYTGLRSGSNDYLPIIGKMIDASNPSPQPHFHPNLTMINGSGGYGFVLAPYIAKQLCDFIVEGREIESFLTPLRFYKRYLKGLTKPQ